MTYPQQPQGWPQQQPMPPQQPWPGNYQQQPAAPGGWPQPAPPAQQQQPQAPAATPVAPPPGGYQWDDDGIDPSRGGGVSPTARHLVGRTVIIVPKMVDENASYNGQQRPTAHFDLYVVDGGPIEYGDSQDRMKPRPNTHRVATPAYFPAAMSGNGCFVAEVRAKAGKGLSVGVVERGDKAFMIVKCAKTVTGGERPDGEQRISMAQALWFAHTREKTWTPPVPELINAAPGGYGTVGYGQPPAPQQVPQQQYVPGAPYPPSQAPAQYPMGAPQPSVPAPGWPQGATQGWPAPAQQQAQQPQPSPAAAPPGFEGVWASYLPEQQQQILQALAAQGQQPQPAAAAPPQGPAQPSWP